MADDQAPKEEEKARVESWKNEILNSDFDGPDGEEEGLWRVRRITIPF